MDPEVVPLSRAIPRRVAPSQMAHAFCQRRRSTRQGRSTRSHERQQIAAPGRLYRRKGSVTPRNRPRRAGLSQREARQLQQIASARGAWHGLVGKHNKYGDGRQYTMGCDVSIRIHNHLQKLCDNLDKPTHPGRLPTGRTRSRSCSR